MANPKDECYTPKWLFDKLGIEFDLDPAHPVEKLNWIPVKHVFNHIQDGLKQDWFGNVWMNPPFSQAKLWATKFLEHGQGLAILPISNSYWSREVWNRADAITITSRSTKFVRTNGDELPIRFPTFLVALGAQNVEALKKLNEYKVR